MASLHQPVWTLSFEEVYESLDTAANGLSQDEATERLEKFGSNELPEPSPQGGKKKMPFCLSFLHSFLTFVQYHEI